ncbi:HAD family hydrolase [Saccharophagus degradans]|uniref:HAD-IB family hydrolase n=1 Tax=Saccharophagus degradans TaxID=86304 RepID=A0AAW7XA25_9GAMM|nr:HAD-IB family hydrolase [Saccharophagus degradans]MDO6423712.1 HAD-IB family hydrolase [Saccharophagus degradans]MDO6607617.1 HAD-IB family hydrolase [Saccharophagus degradans]
MGNKAAFFDVDGTIISTKSMVSFARYLELNTSDAINVTALSLFLKRLYAKLSTDEARADLNRHYFSIFKGVSQAEVEKAAEEWYAEMEQAGDFYIASTVAEIKRLQAEGYRIVLVTGSFAPLLSPLIKRFNIDAALHTTPEAINGVYTGEVIGSPCIGETKRTRILRYALDNNIDLAASWAFGDDDSDLPMLKLVGNGVRIDPVAAY